MAAKLVQGEPQPGRALDPEKSAGAELAQMRFHSFKTVFPTNLLFVVTVW